MPRALPLQPGVQVLPVAAARPEDRQVEEEALRAAGGQGQDQEEGGLGLGEGQPLGQQLFAIVISADFFSSPSKCAC